MKRSLLIISAILAFSLSAAAQDNGIAPGVQWDTIQVVRPAKPSEHLIGVRYNFAFTGVMMNPDLTHKAWASPFNISLLYTFYHPLWRSFNYFGLQVGVKYGRFGYSNDKYDFEHLEQKISYVEIPFVSAAHIDIGEHIRILISLGLFGSYRISTTKDNGWDCFDNRWGYGLIGGAGFAVRFAKRFEIHIEGAYQHDFSYLFDPQKMSSDWWLFVNPYHINISAGFHVKIK